MSFNPKLEVFTIGLKPIRDQRDSFRALLERKFPLSRDKSDKHLLKKLLELFIRKIDSDRFITSTRKKKAIGAYGARNANRENPSPIKLKSREGVIQGVIEGGKFGKVRTKSDTLRKNEKEDLTVNNVILDKFYFMLHVPVGESNGVLILQSYTSDSISDIFTDFLAKLFSLSGAFAKAEIHRYFPNRFKDAFREESNVSEFSFDSELSVKGFESETEFTENFQIRIIAKSKNGIARDLFPSIMNALGGRKFDDKFLVDFGRKKGKLKNEITKKESSFVVDEDTFDIRPTIYLEEYINVEETGLPNFDELEEFCAELLSDIIQEIFPNNVVER